MDHKKFTFSLLLILITAVISFGQNKDEPPTYIPREVKTAFYYSFTGATSQAEIDLLASEVKAISKDIIGFKAIFKPENHHSELKVTVLETLKTPESDVQFNVSDLKTILLNHNYSPLDLRVEHLHGH